MQPASPSSRSHRWRLLLTCGLLASGSSWWIACRTAPTSELRLAPETSVLLITVDTLRRDALGWVSGANTTPAIDRLAAEGFRFPSAVTPVPLTLPAHASMLTGRHPRRHGVRVNGQVLGGGGATLAEALNEAGYATAAFVSGFPLRALFGLDRGFQTYDDRLPGGREGWLERPASDTTAAALDWIRLAEPPWFVWVHYYDPHAPYEPPRSFWQPGPRGSYDGEVAYADHAIGELLAGIPEETRGRLLTVFTADHGESFGEHEEHDHGLFLYDTTMLVPLILHHPDALPAGQSDASPRLTDLMPTVLELLNLRVPADLQGVSVLPVLQGGSLAEATALLETRYPWTTYGWAPLRALRSAEWKVVDAPRVELYDLRADPLEHLNLATDQPQRAAEMLRQLDAAAAGPSPKAKALLDAEVLEQLSALGYVGGGSVNEEPPESLADPKDRIAERNLLLQAESLLQARRFAEALAIFDQVLASDPDNKFATLRSGMALLKSGNLRAAIPRLERSTELDPSQPEARFALADALTRVGRYSDAVPQWMETIRLQPRRVAAWSNLGSALGWDGRMAEAIEAFAQAAELEPDNADLWANLAAAERVAGRHSDAEAHFEKASRLADGG